MLYFNINKTFIGGHTGNTNAVVECRDPATIRDSNSTATPIATTHQVITRGTTPTPTQDTISEQTPAPINPGPSTSETAESTDVSFAFDKPYQPTDFKFPKRKFAGSNDRAFKSDWFNEFKWLHYDEKTDTVLCFICAKQNSKGNLKSATKKEEIFITKGFSNWKKALDKFQAHQSSNCHLTAFDYQVNIPQCGNVLELTNEQRKKTMETNRRYLMKIVENLQYFCRQGQPVQGATDQESNFYQLLKLRGRDDPALVKWMEKESGDKYTSHDIQNEIIEIMAHQLQRNLVKDIGSKFFSIIADEYTDISNKEQLSICLRWVDENFDAHEDFFGFYNVPNIESNTIFLTIKDALIRLRLSLSQCRGQCYDGASNMLGKRSGVAKKILECQPKAHPTHCHGHSLSLSVKDATNNCKILSDTMDNTNEIVKLIKFSPKRENILGDIKENLYYEGEEGENVAGLAKFSATRWTVRAICFQRVLENYEFLLKLWDECLEKRLHPEVRGRVLGCQAQMKSFDFFFGLHLGQTIFRQTDNLSATLQSTKMSAVSGKHIAKLTLETLKRMRNDDSFKAFYETVLKKKKPFTDVVSEPELPRKRRAPARFEVGQGAPSFPTKPEELYRRVYFEALDLIIASITERFDQPSFKAYMNLERLLLGSLDSSDTSTEIGYIREHYSDDIRMEYLIPQLDIFKILMRGEKLDCFSDILKAIKNLDSAKRCMISEVIQICILIHVNPATSASGERSFSTARRIKSWLRANMSQKRFNHIALLNTHKTHTDNLRLVDVANEFISRNENRKRNFGTFTVQDLLS